MDSALLRKTYLDFFAERQHEVVSSASLVPDDPGLLLTIAGMVPFKPYLSGERPPPFDRAASSQKCFREVDIDQVGRNRRTLTFFEMLGNWSFGDYFKKEACVWAWEFMTESLGLDGERLRFTVFETDDEAADIWADEVGVPRDRIIRRSREHGNFWDMGVAGPAGPCSELLYDLGPGFGEEFIGGEIDDERYLECWNLVFMQYLIDDDLQITGELPNRNVDTGMGLERMALVLQNVTSVFEIDTLASLMHAAQGLSGRVYGRDDKHDVALRVLAEHSRSMTFLISDGVVPGNVGRGYVLRRLIRRAVRYARLLGVEKSIIPDLVDITIATYAPAYPDLESNRQLIQRVIEKEENRFAVTLRYGMGLLDQEIAQAKDKGSSSLSGDSIFRLHDTYGFPFDLAAEIAADEGLTVSRDDFDALMREQKERARAARGKPAPGERGELQTIVQELGSTDFVGHETLISEGTVAAVLSGSSAVTALEEGAEGELVLDRTAFYAEAGGQVGDRGEIRTPTGRFLVEDTQWGVPGLIIHRGRVVSGSVERGQIASGQVDAKLRAQVREAHTATHLLHWALRDLLGDHVRQQGSLVEPGRLRFDFSHLEAVAADQIEQLEEEMNSRVITDDPVHAFWTTYDYAVELGAMALFGEKYGEHVRVVEVGDYSKELCGGTHVSRSGQVGVIKLIHEGSVAAGTRRVEAVTGMGGLNYLKSQAALLSRVAELLKTNPDRVLEKLQKVLATLADLERGVAQQEEAGLKQEVARIIGSEELERLQGAALYVLRRDALSQDRLRKFALAVREGIGSGAVIIGGLHDGKANVVAAVSDDLVKRGLSSRELVSNAGLVIGGGGGGNERLAVAGGPKAIAIDEAIGVAAARAREALGSLPPI